MSIRISGKKKSVIICLLLGVLSIPALYLKAIHTFVKDPFYIDKIKSAWQGAEYLGNEGVIRQNKKNNCGPVALKMIFDKLKIEATLKELEIKAGMTNQGTTLAGLMECARSKGLNAEAWWLTFEDFKKIDLPVIVFIEGDHFAVVDSFTKNAEIILLDPAIGKLKIEENKFKKIWKGETLILNY